MVRHGDSWTDGRMNKCIRPSLRGGEGSLLGDTDNGSIKLSENRDIFPTGGNSLAEVHSIPVTTPKQHPILRRTIF